jgi:cytochrome b6-f complex iron-sulfur subunit
VKRTDFLKQLGFSGAAIFATYCIGGLSACSSSANISPNSMNSSDFTLDLNATENSILKNKGGFLVKNNVVIANTAQGNYVAVTRVCSHEGRQEVIYRSVQNDFYCFVHGALFDVNGNGLNSEGMNGLKLYNIQLNGNLLRVFS